LISIPDLIKNKKVSARPQDLIDVERLEKILELKSKNDMQRLFVIPTPKRA
jgi:hypothetical protein